MKIIKGMTNKTTRARVRAGYPVRIYGGVVFGCDPVEALGFGDGEKNKYIVGQAYARATPPPRHMLCNVPIDFVEI